MPTRFAKQLTQIMRGGIALGIPRERLLNLATRCARDSMPPLRLAALLDVAAHPKSRVGDVRRRLQKPRSTADRTLQDLHALGLLELHEDEISPDRTVWSYSLAPHTDRAALARLT
jgi:DNA-binding MarR family transcriptional regulator